MSVRRYDTIALGLLKNKKNKIKSRKNAKSRFFTSRGACANSAIIAIFDWKLAVEHDGSF